jgi:hypothetical protein
MTILAERPTAPADRDTELTISIDPYDPRTNAENFDLHGWLATFDPRLLAHAEGRRTLTELDPLLFAYVYLRKHLKDALGLVTFADAHFLWVRAARRLIGPSRGPREDRRAFVAPRSCGKSTWWYLVVPLWAGAHKHTKFAAAFADSGSQAELHLATFKAEQADNALLRSDFTDFCNPARRHTGRTVADNQNMLHTRSGFTFVAKGIDSTSLGMKMGADRPDLIILDDVEPPEATYSLYQRSRRLSTIQNAILPLNEAARVIVVGTVTMPGSIIHELVRHAKGEGTEEWVTDERFKTHHTQPIIQREDGSERSVWPEKWPMEYLDQIRHTDSFKLNYANDPRGIKGAYWSASDITVLPAVPVITRQFLFVDPPAKEKKTSDECGLAVVGLAPGTQQDPTDLIRNLMGLSAGQAGFSTAQELLGEMLLAGENLGQQARLDRAVVLDAWGVRATGHHLKKIILQVLGRWPGVQAVVVENNQGGDLWLDVLEGLPVRLITYPAVQSKEVRFARALTFYQNRRVCHAKDMPLLVDQLTGFPKAPLDDIADAVVAGVLRLLWTDKRKTHKNKTLTPR